LKILYRFCLRAGISLSGLLLAVLPSLAHADYSWNFPTPVTPIARDTLEIHNHFMIVITILFVVVFGIMIYSMVKHRKSVGHQPARFTGPTGTVQWI
jgi:cytochrome c oxidase subunit 2